MCLFIIYAFLCWVEMSEKTTVICLFHGGKFVRCPMLEYIGRKMNLIYVNIGSISYERFIRDLKNGVNGIFGKLSFKLPEKSLENRLKYIWNDSIVIDLIFYYLHHGLVEIYGEYVDQEVGEGTGQCDGEGDDEGVNQRTGHWSGCWSGCWHWFKL